MRQSISELQQFWLNNLPFSFVTLEICKHKIVKREELLSMLQSLFPLCYFLYPLSLILILSFHSYLTLIKLQPSFLAPIWNFFSVIINASNSLMMPRWPSSNASSHTPSPVVRTPSWNKLQSGEAWSVWFIFDGTDIDDNSQCQWHARNNDISLPMHKWESCTASPPRTHPPRVLANKGHYHSILVSQTRLPLLPCQLWGPGSAQKQLFQIVLCLCLT